MGISASEQKKVSAGNTKKNSVALDRATTQEKTSTGAFTKLGNEIKRKYYFSQTMKSQGSGSGS